MIQNYDSNRVYEIYEIQQTGKKYKIGEIENHVFYDVNKRGKRLEHKYSFSNDHEFWNQFKNISIKKISRPLGGFEPVVWGWPRCRLSRRDKRQRRRRCKHRRPGIPAESPLRWGGSTGRTVPGVRRFQSAG